ncbi:MAG: DUF2062 domain-containing protein [Desulfovibrionales bacterium]
MKYAYLRIVRNKATPHSTALGFSVGVFFGFLPIIPFQTILALASAFVLRCGKVGAALGTWVSNPFNVAFLYFLSYKIGRFILPVTERIHHPGEVQFTSLIQKGGAMAVTMLTGGLILAIPFSTAAYFLSRYAISRYHELRGGKLRRFRRRKEP